MKHWKDVDAFKNQLRQSEGKPEYSFYDGPPFATGSPHYGHILAGTIKVRAPPPARQPLLLAPCDCVLTLPCAGCEDALCAPIGLPCAPQLRLGLPRSAG
jgi:hypothetical protein